MFRFDPLTHTVLVGDKSCTLPPLSYQLLKILADSRNEIVTSQWLMERVWGDVVVSPETIKQRVFLLRAALTDAGIDQNMLQSIRGQGYRLVVGEPPEAVAQQRGMLSKITPARRWLVAGLAGLLGLAAYYSIDRPVMPANNRVVFWQLFNPSAQQRLYAQVTQRWISSLSGLEGVNYVASNQVVESINERPGLQSRAFRAALVSFWTLYDRDGEPYARMQLLEPKTETVLLSIDLDVTNDRDVREAIDRQAIAIHRILMTNILPLDQDSVNNTDHPAWQQLRLLSLPTIEIQRARQQHAILPGPAKTAFALIARIRKDLPENELSLLATEIRKLHQAHPDHFDVQRALVKLHDAEGSCVEIAASISKLAAMYPAAVEKWAACTP